MSFQIFSLTSFIGRYNDDNKGRMTKIMDLTVPGRSKKDWRDFDEMHGNNYST